MEVVMSRYNLNTKQLGIHDNNSFLDFYLVEIKSTGTAWKRFWQDNRSTNVGYRPK